MKEHSPSDEFVRNLTGCQNRLYAYIFSLVPSSSEAGDLLQETNLTLWRKADQFTPGTNFAAWASKVAYYQVLKYRKLHQRDRLLFDDALLGTLAKQAGESGSLLENRREALRQCLGSLPPRQRDLVRVRYEPGGTVKAVAESLGRTPTAIASALLRIRRALLECLRRTLASGDES